MIDVNLWGTIHTFKAAVPHLNAAGGGDIVNISPTAGRRAAGAFASYATSKHAVNGFTESIRQELDGEGVRVCVVGAPSFVLALLAGRICRADFARAGGWVHASRPAVTIH